MSTASFPIGKHTKCEEIHFYLLGLYKERVLPMLVTATTKERENNEKELYNIHVELQSAKYILFW